MEKVKLGNVAEVQAGQTAPKPDMFNDNQGLPFIRAGHLEELILDYNSISLLPKIDTGEYDIKLKIAPRNSILFAKSGMSIMKNRVLLLKDDTYFVNHLANVICKESLEPEYLRYFIEWYKPERLIVGESYPSINLSEIKDLEIPLPSLSVQKSIAAQLDKADELIQYNRQLLEKYDELQQSLFLEMFGDPVLNEKGWQLVTIEDLATNDQYSIKRGPFGGALKKEIFVDDGYLVYEQYHALNDDYTMARYFIDEQKFQELKAFEVKPKDIIISCSGVYLGKLSIVPESARKGIINQALLKLTLDETIMKNIFFVFLFSNPNFKNKYFDSNRGAGIPNFPPMKEFKKFPFILPPIELQNEFASRIESIEYQKELVKEALKKSEDVFNGLLQEYFYDAN